MNRLGISIAIIFTVVLGLYIPIWLEDEPQVSISNMDDALIPNYQVNNLRSKLFDSTGKLTHQVEAIKMEHYDQLGFVTFERPIYTIFVGESSRPWEVNAEQGTLYDDNRIHLERSVFVNSLSNDEFIKQISTHFIEIDLSQRTLNSDQPVQISGVDYLINSIGFKANLDTQIYELSEHVQTEYRPKP